MRKSHERMADILTKLVADALNLNSFDKAVQHERFEMCLLINAYPLGKERKP